MGPPRSLLLDEHPQARERLIPLRADLLAAAAHLVEPVGVELPDAFPPPQDVVDEAFTCVANSSRVSRRDSLVRHPRPALLPASFPTRWGPDNV